MKRFLSLALCVALCLTLAACGGSPASSRGDHDYLLQMLDEGNYTGAVDYINRLAREAAEQNKPDPSQHPLLTKLTGTWEEYNYNSNEQPDPAFTFTADGTCTVDGKDYLWQVNTDYTSDDYSLYISILDGATKVYSFSVYKDKDTGIIRSDASQYDQADGFSQLIGSFVNYDHYEKIDLTTDNFETYFEYIDYSYFDTNEFDEIESVTVGKRLVLKKEYHARLFRAVTDVAVELSYLSGTQYGSYDLAAQTFSLDGEYEPNNKGNRYTNTTEMGEYSTSNGDPYYGLGLFSSHGYTSSSGTDAGKQYFSGYHKEHKIERVQGALYLVKTEE